MGLGNNIERTSAPFVVLKPVLTTSPIAGLPGLPSTEMPPLILTIRVPAKRKLLAKSPATSFVSFHLAMSSSLTGILLTGILSPVSILSLRMASPESRNMSAGIVVRKESLRLMTSPGAREVEELSLPFVILVKAGRELHKTYMNLRCRFSPGKRIGTSRASWLWSTTIRHIQRTTQCDIPFWYPIAWS